jgi:hypothetical protein
MIKKGNCVLIFIASLMIFSQNVLGWVTTRLTWSGGPSLKPVMAVDSLKNYYVFYADETPGNYEIFFKKSTDSGTAWTTQRLTWNAGTSQGVDVAIDIDDNIHLVWMDTTPGNFEIFYKNSTDGGSTWSTKQVSMTPDTSMMPAIVTDSNKNIHVVWHDNSPGNYEIFYAMSTDSGTTWASKRLTWNQGESMIPALAVDSTDVIHLVWSDSSPGNLEIYHRTSATGGTTWTAAKRLSWNLGQSSFAKIATDLSDNIHVVWEDNAFLNYEIVHKSSTDGGTTWTTQRLTWNPGKSKAPDITIGFKNIIHIVWSDGSPGNREIYYKWSSDGGASWTTERLTWNVGASNWPFVLTHTTDLVLPTHISIIPAFSVHVLWDDSSPGNVEIFHKYK